MSLTKKLESFPYLNRDIEYVSLKGFLINFSVSKDTKGNGIKSQVLVDFCRASLEKKNTFKMQGYEMQDNKND